MEFKVYLDKAQEFRWKLQSQNGKIVADSGEGYRSKENCIDAIQLIRKQVWEGPVHYDKEV